MARDYAQVKLDMWGDDSWRALSPGAQHLYLALLTSPSLSNCGVADWRPKRLVSLAAGWALRDLYAAADELVGGLFIVVDEDTEEVLIRSFLRNDGIMKQPKMAAAVANAHTALASHVLRGVVVHELARLRDEQPDLKGWNSKSTELLAKESVDPATYPLGNALAGGPPAPPDQPPPNPSVNGHAKGSVKGSDNGSVNGYPKGSERGPKGVDEGVGKGEPTPPSKGSVNPWRSPAPAPAPATSTKEPSLRSGSFARESGNDEPALETPRKPHTQIPHDWQPTDEHRAYATEHRLEINREALRFRNHAKTKDRRVADWDAAFTTWLDSSRQHQQPADPYRLPAHTRRDATTGLLVER